MDKHSSDHSKLTPPDGCITSYHLRYSRYSRSVLWRLPILFAESRSNRQPCSCCLKDSKNLNLILLVSLKFFKFVVCPILLIASPFIFLCLFWHWCTDLCCLSVRLAKELWQRMEWSGPPQENLVLKAAPTAQNTGNALQWLQGVHSEFRQWST